ncbi:MAG: hypothetical protein Q7S13_04940 [Candidatus Omnitrophota bacterium]|nr:hypothetical protein [Candidatus Omnitrophota bacterium]
MKRILIPVCIVIGILAIFYVIQRDAKHARPRTVSRAIGQIETRKGEADNSIGPSREIVLAGPKDDPQTQEMLKSLYSRFIPNKIVIFRPTSNEEAIAIVDLIPFIKGQRALEGKTTAYVCENYNCGFSTNDITKFEQLLDQWL